MRGKKPQKGNQLDCHSRPFNMNTPPLTTKLPEHRTPSKLQARRDDKFFKRAEPSLPAKERNVELELTVSCLLATMTGPR